MALLILGGVELLDFEVPTQVSFGGAQQLAVHRLIGGTRVVDVLGPDDAAIRWAGVFCGALAGDRARLFDAMRVAGMPLGLTWHEFSYNVLIDSLSMDFCNPWWIPYQISCTVVVDQAQGVQVYLPGLAGAILGDLTSASNYYNVSSALSATSVADALTPGTADFNAASVAVAGTVGSINAGIDQTQASIVDIGAEQASLTSTGLATLVSSAGSLAQLCAARGYVERCGSNLVNEAN